MCRSCAPAWRVTARIWNGCWRCSRPARYRRRPSPAISSLTRRRPTGSAKAATCTASWFSKSVERRDKMAGNGQMVIDLDKKRMTAMAQKDIATLNRLLSDDLIYTHSSARLDTKQSLIGNMESGSTVYTAVEPSDVKAQDLGDAVVLTGACRISVMSQGRPNSFSVRFTDVYANKGGQWQMVTWQSTRLPE